MTGRAQLLQQALAWHRAGRLTEAERAYRTVLARDPANADALNLLGVLIAGQGQREAGLALLDRAAAAAPALATVHHNRATVLAALGRLAEAEQAYRRAIALKPDHVDAYLDLGVLLHRAGDVAAAAACFRDVLRLAPADARAQYNLGRALADAGQFEAAEAALHAALQLTPDAPDVGIALAKVYADTGRTMPAVALLRQIVGAAPDNALAWTNLGVYLAAADDHDGALAAFDRALALDPDNPTARINRGLARLVCGRLGPGWDDYWVRADSTGSFRFRKLDLPWPRWRGEPLAGADVFVWAEQGLGDEILFATQLAEIAAEAGRCVFGCSPRLVKLFRRALPRAEVVPLDTALADLAGENFHYQTALQDIGRWRRRSFAAFPNRAASLTADPAAVVRARAQYCAEFGTDRRLVGFSWRSFAAHVGDDKTPPFDTWRALAARPEVQLVHFQYGPPGQIAADLARLEALCGLRPAPALVDVSHDDFADVAAHLAAMDAIISVSNTTAHLGGALGVPTLVVVPAGRARLWYWFKHGTYSPWYRSVRLARAPAAGAVDSLTAFLAGLAL